MDDPPRYTSWPSAPGGSQCLPVAGADGLRAGRPQAAVIIGDAMSGNPALAIDPAYDGNATRKPVWELLGYNEAEPPHPVRQGSKEYRRTLFQRVKECRWVFTRYGKLGVTRRAFALFAIIVETIK